MITKYENKMLKLNYDMKGHKKDTVLPVKVDTKGVPVERYWRDRITDAKRDSCVQWVKPKTTEGK